MQNVDFAWIELTNKCNLTCNHCYANSGPHEELEGVLSRKDWINIIENLADQGCKRIQFIGGEASLVNYLPDLLKVSRNVGITDIEIYTNATRIKEDLFSAILETDTRIATSIYSHEPKIHDSFTNTNGSWKRTIKNIQRFVNNGIYVRVGVILDESNLGNRKKYMLT